MLRVTRENAKDRMESVISRAQSLAVDADEVATTETYEDWRQGFSRWRDVSEEAIRSLFTTDRPALEFRTATSPRHVTMGPDEAFAEQRDGVARAITKVMAFVESLDFFDLAPGVSDASPGQAPLREERTGEPKVFLVHGHDESVREAVARLLARTGPAHEVVILHEQPDRGQTIIEKFEAHAGAADHAVVLVTGDDIGGASAEHLQRRARQNVVLELGYFVGRLGRAGVTVLYEPGVELPSDMLGVLYIELDAADAWRYRLLSELRDAGLSYDLNIAR